MAIWWLFADFLALRVEESLMLYINALSKTTRKNELLPLSLLAKETRFSQEYLSLLARRGMISATKLNNVWHTSREDLEKYLSKAKNK